MRGGVKGELGHKEEGKEREKGLDQNEGNRREAERTLGEGGNPVEDKAKEALGLQAKEQEDEE